MLSEALMAFENIVGTGLFACYKEMLNFMQWFQEIAFLFAFISLNSFLVGHSKNDMWSKWFKIIILCIVTVTCSNK